MKHIIFAAAVLAAVPAYANNTKPAPKPTPSQVQYDKAIAKANASLAQKQKAAAKATAGANASGSASGGSASNSGDKVEGSWGFAYDRDPVTVPQAVVSPDVMVLSRGIEVGPLASYSDQRGELTPDGLLKLSAVLRLASQYDGTPNGRAEALDVVAVLCAKEPDLVRIRFGDKCADLDSIFPALETGE